MEIDGWYDGYKVRSFPWIDGKTIYFSVAYYQPGAAISNPPAWEETIFITNDEEGRRVVQEYTSSLANYVSVLRASSITTGSSQTS